MAVNFFKELEPAKKHKEGAVIIGGQAQGKSYWASQKSQNAWVDSDDLLGQYEPSQLKQKAKEVEDLVKLGAWVVTSTWWDLKAFNNNVAVVSIPTPTLEKYALLKKFDSREAIEQATKLTKAAKQAGVPVFSSFDQARFHLTISLSGKYATK